MTSEILKIPSPLESIHYFPFDAFIKRDDLIHTEVSGNKYRKLKYLLEDTISEKKSGIITFGGAFSNHIYATAALCHYLAIPAVGIIRGEPDPNNPTIQFALSHNMQLHFVDRASYKDKNSDTILSILQEYKNYNLIPEGGDHPLAVKGVEEIIDELPFIPDYITVALGTGTTAAGLLQGLLNRTWSTTLLAFTTMKNESFEKNILSKLNLNHCDQLKIIHDYHFGGYARITEELIKFCTTFYKTTGIRLDPIYTSKMLYGIHDLAEKKYFKLTDKLVIYHSGGLQGWDGYHYLKNKKV